MKCWVRGREERTQNWKKNYVENEKEILRGAAWARLLAPFITIKALKMNFIRFIHFRKPSDFLLPVCEKQKKNLKTARELFHPATEWAPLFHYSDFYSVKKIFTLFTLDSQQLLNFACQCQRLSCWLSFGCCRCYGVISSESCGWWKLMLSHIC